MAGNHWTFVKIYLGQRTLLYIDPKGNNDAIMAPQFANYWGHFAMIWNQENTHVPDLMTFYRVVTKVN